jgi:transposase InsO family protein
LYKAIGITKPAVLKMEKRMQKEQMMLSNLILIIMKIRNDHPTIGVRTMYHMIRPEGIGRDKFELLCKELGFSSNRIRNYRITTDSRGVTRFDNLTLNITLTRINQLWQSDITYFDLNGRFYYITFIIDAFSRLIVGYSVSDSLNTEKTTLKAIKMAVSLRGSNVILHSSLILHSDGGGQYYCKEFVSFLRSHNIRSSMCEHPWENGKAERINGIIKNNYLIHRNINNYKDLCKEVSRSVRLYNESKPHISLHRMTPNEFEKTLYLQGLQSAIATEALDVI